MLRPKPLPEACLTLLCFHYAGGNALVFRRWPDYLPAEIEVWAMQLPGRGNLFREAPFTYLEPLRDVLVTTLRPHLERPFAIFGYSMGALVAFEFIRALRRQHLPLPVHLFVAARRAPQLPPPRNHLLSGLPDADILDLLRRDGNTIIENIVDNSVLLGRMLATLRADCQVAEHYVYSAEAPLPCPITAFGGASDPYIHPEHLQEWRAQTTNTFSMQSFAGGHFFLQNAEPLLAASIAHALRPLCSPATPPLEDVKALSTSRDTIGLEQYA
jgi:medium-chain acyl-[acyl-carrier-protein] hydrolase